MAPRPKKARNTEKILALTCRWTGCNEQFELHLDDYKTFAEHMMQHINQYLNEINCNSEQDLDSFPYKCCWNNCAWEVSGKPDEFTRHLMFHAYHSRLKCLGAFEMILCDTNQCTLDVETEDLLPEVSEPFLCKWDSCNLNLFCPEQFYKHVEMHAYNAGKEDVMVVAEDKEKLYSLSNTGEMVNGMPVQKIMQSVCRWEGCSFLGKSAVKIKDHCRTHTGERQLACPTCGGFFANKTKFIDHLTRQNAKLYEKFQCSHCLKRCASERLLRDHMRHHVNHVKCPHCDMTCANPSALRGHIKFRHSIDRPFKCSMCKYSCKAANDLKRHEETHFANRFQCETENCDFLAKTLAGLRSHVKLVHEQKRSKEKFMCHICQGQFSRGYFLTRHLKTEHNFSWPSGHMRFRYKKHEDGFYRLQMVRFESAELSEMLTDDSEQAQEIEHNWVQHETDLLGTPLEVNASMVDIQSESASRTGIETPIVCADLNTVYASQGCTTLEGQTASVPSGVAPPLEVNLCDGYVEMLHYYEAMNANQKGQASENTTRSLQCLENDARSTFQYDVNSVSNQGGETNIDRPSSCHVFENLGTNIKDMAPESFSESIQGVCVDAGSKLQTTSNTASPSLVAVDNYDSGKIKVCKKGKRGKVGGSDVGAAKQGKVRSELVNRVADENGDNLFGSTELVIRKLSNEKVCGLSREVEETHLVPGADDNNTTTTQSKICQEPETDRCETATLERRKGEQSTSMSQQRNQSSAVSQSNSFVTEDHQSKRKRLSRGKATARSKKSKRMKIANDGKSESLNSNEYEQILDVSRTLLSLHNSDKDSQLFGIPF